MLGYLKAVAPRSRDAEQAMANATNYDEWSAAALEHDEITGADAWKLDNNSDLFDAADIIRRRDTLAEAIETDDSHDLLFTLNEGIHGNIGGMGNPKLYNFAKVGTKQLISEYVASIIEAIEVVANAPESAVSFGEKLDFFQRASLCYGRSALMLSGGGGRIYFHHGVVDALLSEGLLPDVLSGSSAGGWLCAQLGSRTDEELEGYLESKRYDFGFENSFMQATMGARRMRSSGLLLKARQEVIDELVGDMTFAEAHEHTGRMINISVASPDKHHRARLLNAITSPNVTLRSACRATSCIPRYTDPEMLEAKDHRGRIVAYLPNQRWIDGAYSDDLPMKRLQRLYAVNHFVVSQINPISMVVPFLRSDAKSGRQGYIYRASNLFFNAMNESAKVVRDSRLSPSQSLTDPFLKFYRLTEQTYWGDITIEAGFDRRTLDHSVFSFSNDQEISEMIMAGRRATWPRVEQIRNAVLISKAINGHLKELEDEAVERGGSRS